MTFLIASNSSVTILFKNTLKFKVTLTLENDPRPAGGGGEPAPGGGTTQDRGRHVRHQGPHFALSINITLDQGGGQNGKSKCTPLN